MITKDGSRIDFGENPEWPLSIDLKITECCFHGCPWCHEDSGPSGKHGDPEKILSHLSGLPKTTEVAIGGGNPLEHPGLQSIIDGLGCIVNMTIRDLDLLSPDLKLPNGLTALGISVTEGGPELGSLIQKLPPHLQETWVPHLILGVTSLETYERIKKISPRILWLGYKTWGRGRSWSPEDWKGMEKEITKDLGRRYPGIIAFDNLALSQLRIKSKMLKSEWEAFYQGPEFSRSMYVDGVKGMYSPSSTSGDRVSWDTIRLSEYYVKNHTNPRES